ncbi:chaperonin 10-like protein [Suillus bovinus]|uniref:chaperonin 10-like protein n=1 Tax=Suillus bovinus TaxID=48563 RepID=UPI001B870F29|nr:chaperonin 10-like protein [Suillus bovinus]KAG2127619.1 chaperonin 10-like protein [Suillus bovinus]
MSLPTHTPVWRIKNSPQDSVVLDFSDDATFALTEEPLPHVEDGEMLVETLYISNDPAQRGWIQKGVLPERLYTAPVREGDVMATHSIARVLAIKDNTGHGFKVNDLVYCLTAGWRRYAVIKIGPSSCLPVIAVGNVVVQYAKKVLKAKKVIAITGSDKKCQWIKELGADVALNYKSDTFPQDLIDATSDFEILLLLAKSNALAVFVLDQVIPRIKAHGRIAACGAISGYNKDSGKLPTMGTTWIEVITNRCLSKASLCLISCSRRTGLTEWATEAFPDIAGAVQRGEITLEGTEDIVWGRLFTGGNTGKLVTKLTFSA